MRKLCIATGTFLLSLNLLTAGVMPPIETMTIDNNRVFRVNGKPFFPLMGWLQNTSNLPKLKAAKFNTIAGYYWNEQQNVGAGNTANAAQYAEKARQAGLYFIAPYMPQHPAAMATLKDGGVLLAWIQDDEPDMPQKPLMTPKIPVADVREHYQAIKAFDPQRPVLMTFTGHFIPSISNYSEAVRQQLYADYASNADVLGFDWYPIFGSNRPDWLIRTADGVSLLRSIAGAGKPVYEWIETFKGSQWIDYVNQKDVEPRHIRAEAWMAIIRGATALGYFTHVWRPGFKEFAPTGEQLAEITRLNGQITALSAVILSPPPAQQASISLREKGLEDTGNIYGYNKLPAEIMMRKHNDMTYLFANNLDMEYRQGTAVISLPGLKEGQSIEVVNEGRTITAQAGRFSDLFEPIGVHIYRVTGN